MSTFRRGPLLLLFALDNRVSELMTSHFADSPLTPADYGVTSALRLLQPARPTTLAHTLGMRPTTLSNYLNRLRLRGLIVREPDPTDGRAALLRLTAEGERLTAACDPHLLAVRQELDRALHSLGVDPEQVSRTLETVDSALEACNRAQRPSARSTSESEATC